MRPDPLHPAVVHRPIAVAVLAPLFALVAERHIDEHEENAERFLIGGGVALAIVACGPLSGTAGGEPVYRHGAANAYIDGPTGETQKNADD